MGLDPRRPLWRDGFGGELLWGPGGGGERLGLGFECVLPASSCVSPQANKPSETQMVWENFGPLGLEWDGKDWGLSAPEGLADLAFQEFGVDEPEFG